MVQLSAAPRVSVIIIFLNEERFLQEAIDSVRDQSFPDWELILVDDGSTDGSAGIARAAAASDPRISYITHPDRENRGMSASRNAGVAAAQGELIAFLDGDDVWVPEKLAEQVALFDADSSLDMAYGRTSIWSEWQEGAAQRDFCYDLGVEPGKTYPPRSLFPLLLRNRTQTPTTINAIMRRELVDRVGRFEDEFRGMFEDQVFFAKAHLIASCHVDDRIWARYRQHDASCTARSSGTLGDLLARKRFLNWLGGYIRSRQLGDIAVRLEMLRARWDLGRALTRWRLRRLLGRV